MPMPTTASNVAGDEAERQAGMQPVAAENQVPDVRDAHDAHGHADPCLLDIGISPARADDGAHLPSDGSCPAT